MLGAIVSAAAELLGADGVGDMTVTAAASDAVRDLAAADGSHIKLRSPAKEELRDCQATNASSGV
jgi:hypothetical protein